MKDVQPSPDVYKIIYRLSRWKTKSERYFTAFTATEAFRDFYHAFEHGHVNSKHVKVYQVDLYDRFAVRWIEKIHQVQVSSDLELAHEHGRYIYLNK